MRYVMVFWRLSGYLDILSTKFYLDEIIWNKKGLRDIKVFRVWGNRKKFSVIKGMVYECGMFELGKDFKSWEDIEL